MKTLKNFFATFTLVLVFSSFAYAGQIDTPPAAPPPPPPTPLMHDSSNGAAAVTPGATEETTADPFWGVSLSLLQTLLSIF